MISQNAWLRSPEGWSSSAEVKVVEVEVVEVKETTRNKLCPPAAYLDKAECKSAFAGYEKWNMMETLSNIRLLMIKISL